MTATNIREAVDTGNGAQKGPLGGNNPVVDREEAKVDKMIKSICRGC